MSSPDESPELIPCDVAGISHPDVNLLDVLARLQLIARRLRCRVGLVNETPALRDLIGLLGLDDVLPRYSDLAVELGGQPEQREHPSGIEEEADTRDPPA